MNEFDTHKAWLESDRLFVNSPSKAINIISERLSIGIYFLNTKLRLVKAIGTSPDTSVTSITPKLIHEYAKSTSCTHIMLYCPRSFTNEECAHIKELEEELEETIGIEIIDVLQKEYDDNVNSFNQTNKLVYTQLIQQRDLNSKDPVFYELENHTKKTTSEAFKAQQTLEYLTHFKNKYPQILEKNYEALVETCQLISHSNQEIFAVLDIYESKIETRLLSKGTATSTVIDPKNVFDYIEQPKGIIMLHNHPSDSTEPSKADIKTTHRMIKSAKALGIELYDHLIVGKTQIAHLSEIEPELQFSKQSIIQESKHQSNFYDLYDFCNVNINETKALFKTDTKER
ncbi:MAG: JAB domain-containing protein [Culicoidibacterales bacterium]